MSSTGDPPSSNTLPTDSAEAGTQKCSGCACTRPVTEFPFKKKGAGAHDARTKTCGDCTTRKQAWRTKERAEEADGGKKQPLGGNKHKARSDALEQVPLGSFLAFLEEKGKVCDIEALVLASNVAGERRKRADTLAELIWKRLELRFIYHSKHELSTSNQSETTFVYNCAQNAKRQKKSKKVADPKKHRDKDAMDGFDCHGWLSIRVTDNSDVVAVTLTHCLSHVPYCPIDLPDDVVTFISENPNQTVSQLWTEILKKHPKPAFSRATVYARWAQNDRKFWKRDDDEVQSATALLREALELPDGPQIEPIELPNEDGFTGLAFALPQLLGQWGGRIHELALDSTFNTNGSGFELYALLGEVYGSGLPLAYLLLRSSDGEKGGKERYLTRFLTTVRDRWHLNAVFTLTDKDWSEINACRAVFPWAKHQLCYWHVLRAIKTRLAILRRMPAFYRAEEAHTEFSWISEDFVPQQQQTNPDTPAFIPATQAIPTIRLRFNGELVSLWPEMPPQSTLFVDAVTDAEGEAMQLEAEELPVRVEQELEKDEQDAEDGPD
uniref:Nonribosomal peptide synthetase 6 (NPRS 6) ) n=1 Tax=Ganoderma boninense TaxID=34458 RepID=A0A5K1K5E6_9APHY|nr:Nonribosomal peptide synthetase 6 (NPRS 6) (EC (Extracellular siderophore synthetase) [Ganoderma boninense]